MTNYTNRRNKKRVSPVVKIGVVCILMVILIVSIKLNIIINDKKSESNLLTEQIKKTELKNNKMRSEIDSFEYNEETIKKIAREEIGLRENDTIIFENSQPN